MLLTLLGLGASFQAVLSAPALEDGWVAACVMDGAGRVVFEQNANRRMVPASNQKILASLFALDRLGPDYRFKTRFWLEPDRWVADATGDPLLASGTLARMRAELAPEGRPVLAVRATFDPVYPPTWEWDDLPHAYAPRVRGLTIDQGRFEIWAENGEVVPLSDWTGVGTVRGVDYGPYRGFFDRAKGVVRVSGSLPEVVTRMERFALPDPGKSAASLLGGGLASTTSVPDRTPDREFSSPPLSEIVRLCLQPSDNQIAEHLLLAASGKPNYAEASAEAMKWLEEAIGNGGLRFRIIDGSGMSRQNLVTARGLCELLQWAESKPWYSVFRDGLARPGVGTLSNRLDGVPFEGKTGTLTWVNSLSGYVRSSSERPWKVALVFNNCTSSPAEQRKLLDRFVEAVAKEAAVGTNLADQTPYANSPETRRWGSLDVVTGHRVLGPGGDRRVARAGAHH